MTPSTFRRLAPPSALVSVTVNGRMLSLPEGEMLAAALLAEGVLAFDRSVAGAPRGPWCLMGSCFQCTATIDGVPGRRACRVATRAGMTVDVPVLER